jgi:hypothetical protein
MAAQKAKQATAKGVSGPRRGKSRGVRASEKSDEYRFAQNVGEAGTAAERQYEAYALEGIDDPRGDPDVLLDVPVIKVDSIHLEVDDLNARVALRTRVLDLVKLNAGVDVHLGKLRIDIKGVEAQALLKVRLDRVAAIVDRVLTTIDRNPELVKSLGRATEQIGSGAGHALGDTGEAVEDVGEGAEGAVGEVGSGASQAVGEIGEGAGQAVSQVGEGAGQAVGDVGEGAGEAVGNLEQTVEGVGQVAGQTVDEAGNIVDEAGNAVGKAGKAAGGLLGQGGGGGGSAGIPGASASDIAKLAAKAVAEELRSSAKEEAKEIGLAAARKAREVGERRKQRKADELNATEAAMRSAEDLGVDLEAIEGSGSEGRVTIRDVKRVEHARKG